MNDKETSRIYYLDILRILATIAVIGIHVSAQGWYSEPIERDTWSIFSAWDAAVRWAVPGFVMISGALFLTREIDMKRVYSHNIRACILSPGGRNSPHKHFFLTHPQKLSSGHQDAEEKAQDIRPGLGHLHSRKSEDPGKYQDEGDKEQAVSRR